MQMRHGFAGVGAVVEDEAIAAGFQAKFFRDLRSFEQQMAEDLMVFRFRFAEARDRLFGDQENVRRCLRVDVAEGDDLVVFIDNVRRDFAGDDFFKKCFAHGLVVNQFKLFAPFIHAS